MLLAGMQGQPAEAGVGAVAFDRAGRAADVVQVDVDPRMSVDDRVDPAGAGFALRAGRGVRIPVDGEVAQGVARPSRSWRPPAMGTGPTRSMPRCAASTISSAPMYPASTMCSTGARSCSIGRVKLASSTGAAAVATCVIRCGLAPSGSQVSVRWTTALQ